jgi:hypothetical protein
MAYFRILSTLVGLACLAGSVANAQPADDYKGPVAVVVAIPIPAAMTRAAVEAAFTKSAPAFKAMPDLKQKYFTVNDETHKAGGIYLWSSRAAAQAFFSDSWKAGIVSTYGAPAELTWYDAPLIIQGKAGMP